MTLDKILVLLLGVGGVGFIYWFFYSKQEKVIKASNSVDIVVEGGYTPSVISVPLGKITTLNFIRKDDNSCLEEVVLADFKVRKTLPLNKEVSVQINPQRKGTYIYSCGMGMFHGKIVVN